ncbi:lysophospholipid acyltransferase family protein [Endozoicomonas sp.]|uniref:lysophospholipid acyltransferase family protein n=1 Tax=Endozoicomonas sp. TaxID=1892382 RepID=UPI003D9B1CA7
MIGKQKTELLLQQPTHNPRHQGTENMRVTVFNTPVISHFLMFLARLMLSLSGWKIEGQKPKVPRYVLVAAPHTSNWDFFIGIAIGLRCGVKCYWMGKASLFWGPLGLVLRWLGGIPVDRTKRNSLVSQTVCCFKGNKQLGLVICPEGTRSRGNRWRTGFYHIAKGANVPIILGYLDFERKVGGFGPALKPGDNMEKDMAEIQAFYQGINGKFPDCFSPVQPKEPVGPKAISV